MHLGTLIAFLLLFSSVLKVFECSCLVFSLALFILPLAPFLNLIKFSIFSLPSGPWAALPLLTCSPVSFLMLLLQMLCVPRSCSDVLSGPIPWKGFCASAMPCQRSFGWAGWLRQEAPLSPKAAALCRAGLISIDEAARAIRGRYKIWARRAMVKSLERADNGD